MPETNSHEAFEEWYFHYASTDEQKEAERNEWIYKRCWESWDKGARWSVAEVQKLLKAAK